MWTKEQLVGRNRSKIADEPIIKKIDAVKGDSLHNDAYKTFVIAVANACQDFAMAQEQLAEESGLKTALAASIKAEQAACRVATVLHKRRRCTFDYKVAALLIIEQLNQVTGQERVPMQMHR